VRSVAPGRPRVAVLDDDVDFAAVMATLLEDEGMEAVRPDVPASSAIGDVLAAGNYELAIVDVHGVADGDIAVIERLRADRRLSAMPILVCSADIQLLRDSATRLSALPRVLALEKPFRIDVLSGVVGRLLRGDARPSAQPAAIDAAVVNEVESWVAELGRRITWPVFDVWVADTRPGLLRCIATYIATPAFEPFATLSRRTHLPIGGGIPGRVWVSGRSAWIEDLAMDLNFPRLGTARRVGLISAAAAPVVDGPAIIGVVAAYTTMRRREDARVADELTAAAAAARGLFRRLTGVTADGG
jgi:CheY-like chemotaxis protein